MKKIFKEQMLKEPQCTELKTDSKQWIVDLKSCILQSQIKAAIKVDSELLRLYWDLKHTPLLEFLGSTTWKLLLNVNLQKKFSLMCFNH